jgi:hypothetical protein
MGVGIVFMKRIIFCILLTFLLFGGVSFAEEGNMGKATDGALLKVVESTLGKGVKIIKVENIEESPVKGLKQIRVWFESVYGETPILFYMTDDGKMYIAGSIFDSEGNNLTKHDVGNTKPRVIKTSDMELHDEYMFGSRDASVKIVMWLGTDFISFEIFDTLYKIYEANQDKVALYMKFYPTDKADIQQDINRSIALSCFKGKDFMDGIKFLKGASPLWGKERKDVMAFIKEKGFEGCDGGVVKKDMELAKKLRLPVYQTVFINGTILIEDITKENIIKISGVELK